MAPEMIIGDAYNQQVDVWSLGVLIYELITGTHLSSLAYFLPGKLPFDGEKSSKIQSKILLSHPNYSRLSTEAKDLLQHILVSKPSKRITIESVKEHKWISDETTCEGDCGRHCGVQAKEGEEGEGEEVKDILAQIWQEGENK